MRLPKTPTIYLVAFCLSCTNSNVDKPDMVADSKVEQPETEEKIVTRIRGPLEIKVNWEPSGSCVFLESGGNCLKNMDEVRAASPDLHKLHENPRNLAYIAHALQPGISDELFRTRKDYQTWWAKWFEPEDFFSRNFATVANTPSGMDPADIHDATIVDEKLTYYSGRVISIDHGVQMFRNVVDFGSEDWNPKIEELKTTRQTRKSVNDRTVEIFGGLVEGFVHAKGENGSLYLAAKPEAEASPFVWKPNDQAPQRFKTWASLVAKFPKAGSPSIAAELADGINHYSTSSGFRLLKDVQAYKSEYQEGQWDLLKLRYWGDELRVTQFTVTDWSSVVDPFIEDGILIAHFRDNDRQPARLTYPLKQFALQSEREFQSLSTSTLVSDTRLGPNDNDRPRPLPPPELE